MVVCGRFYSASLESGRALFEEGARAFLLVLGRGAQAEVGSLEDLAFALAGLCPLVRGLERQPDRDRSVGCDRLQDCLRTRDELGRGNDLVDQADAIGLLRADHLAGEDELECAALADQPWETLRSTTARQQAQLH